MIRKQLLIIICLAFMVSTLWAAEQTIIIGETFGTSFGKSNANDSELYSTVINASVQSALDAKADSLGADDNYVTDAEKVIIGNTSGTNTGDQYEFTDDLFRLLNSSDVTKEIQFDISGVATSTTRTIIWPDRNIDFTSGGTFEDNLGNPGTNGYVLSSLTDGTRSWIAPGSGSGDLLADGTVPMTANWEYGAFDFGSTGVRVNKGWFEDIEVTNGFSAGPSSDPKYESTDSDAAAGSSKFYGNSSGAYDVIMYFGVEDSTGESTHYVEIDGESETIDFLKLITLPAGNIINAYLATDSVDYTKTDGSYASATPVTDDADNFAANFTGADLYGGTFVANAAGTADLPSPVDGMSFTITTLGAVSVVVEPDTGDDQILDGTQLDANDSATNLSTAGDIILYQYYDATGWLATSNGWTDED